MSDNFLATIKSKKLVLRGSGQEAEDFFYQWENYFNIITKYLFKSFPKISYVADNNSQKFEQYFHNIKIKKPIDTYEDNLFFIVGVYKHEDIFSELSNLGYKENIDFQYHNLFLKKVRFALSEKITDILINLSNNSIIEISELKLKDNSLCSKSVIYKKIEQSNLEENDKNLLLELFLENVLRKWLKLEDKNKSLKDLINYFTTNAIVYALYNVFENNIKDLEPLYKDYISTTKTKKRIKTIGIYSHTFSNGGAQRILSLQISLFLKLGYRIIFFTDYLEDGEYLLPLEVKRIILKNIHPSEMKKRLESYLYYIKKYNIDIMFTILKYNIDSFYETLYFKLINIPVIVESHNTFIKFIKPTTPLNGLWPQIYRMTNKTIVLSRLDKLYWENFYCNTKYIPNPIENGKKLWNSPITFNKRNGKCILWIGRTTAPMKNLNDTIFIMKEVCRKIPDAVLKIVGKNDNLNDFIQSIKGNDLENNIELCGYHVDVSNFYNIADIMLMTSEYEGFPTIMSEAKLRGVPIVMYEIPYLELTRDMRGIIEVPQRDIKAAADAIIKILSNKKLRHLMSIESKQSLYPFVFYDIESSWEEVFDEI